MQTEKDGYYTKVKVHATGNAVDFKTISAVPDVADQIRKLAELRNAEIVSPEEFETKKTELLERLWPGLVGRGATNNGWMVLADDRDLGHVADHYLTPTLRRTGDGSTPT